MCLVSRYFFQKLAFSVYKRLIEIIIIKDRNVFLCFVCLYPCIEICYSGAYTNQFDINKFENILVLMNIY